MRHESNAVSVKRFNYSGAELSFPLLSSPFCSLGHVKRASSGRLIIHAFSPLASSTRRACTRFSINSPLAPTRMRAHAIVAKTLRFEKSRIDRATQFDRTGPYRTFAVFSQSGETRVLALFQFCSFLPFVIDFAHSAARVQCNNRLSLPVGVARSFHGDRATRTGSEQRANFKSCNASFTFTLLYVQPLPVINDLREGIIILARFIVFASISHFALPSCPSPSQLHAAEVLTFFPSTLYYFFDQILKLCDLILGPRLRCSKTLFTRKIEIGKSPKLQTLDKFVE